MSRRISLLLLLACAGATAADIEAGKRLYREGMLVSGRYVDAVVSGDVRVTGSQWRCEACHGRSGMGGIEGGTLVPPVTSEALFYSTSPARADRFASLFEERQTLQFRARARSPRTHPPYTEESVAEALRRGVDSAGQPLDSAMPRYRLGEEDMANLCAYLESLGHAPAVGVDDTSIHFATVITDGVSAGDRASLLGILEAWFRQKNVEFDYQAQKRGRVSWDKEDMSNASRRWVLDVWELKGRPDTWNAQLAAFYERRPVFAVVGGLAAGPWQPIADFCDRNEIPCLFPETALPAKNPERGYTVYFTPGVAGEAATLASWFRKNGVVAGGVLQMYGDSPGARAAAQAFRAAFPGVAERTVSERLAPAPRLAHVVIWADAADLRDFDCTSIRGPVYLSANLLRDGTVPPCQSVYLTYPYAVTDTGSRESVRMKNWQLSRAILPANQRIQLNAQFTVKLLDYCLMHMGTRFSRDYLLETIERETEYAPNPGVFPVLGLGAGQRFASKGGYIVRPSGQRAAMEAVSEWIVP